MPKKLISKLKLLYYVCVTGSFVLLTNQLLATSRKNCDHIIAKVPRTHRVNSVNTRGHKSTPPAASASESLNQNSCQDLTPNTLVRIQELVHGAPVRSVSWLCNTACSIETNNDSVLSGPIAAIGGFTSYRLHPEGSSVEIYEMNALTEQLTETAHAAPTNYVLSVDWCCIDGIAYLALGGMPDSITGFDVWIYRYDIQSHQLQLISTFKHGATINAVSWLCQDCRQPGIGYLAVGGEDFNDINLHILRFDAHCNELSPVTNRSFGAPILSLDWCLADGKTPLLLVGGQKAINDSCQKYNLRVYCGSCTGALNLAGSFYFQGATVRSAKWCCDPDKICSKSLVFAVGGDCQEERLGDNDMCANTQLFVYNALFNQIRPIACTYKAEKVFTLDWVPGCTCTRLTVGSGCSCDCSCEHNINVYQVLSGRCVNLSLTSSALFDHTISSIKWCTFGSCAYLLVGSEHIHNQEPDCHETACVRDCEVALYKAQFCQEQLPPESICERRSIECSADEHE